MGQLYDELKPKFQRFIEEWITSGNKAEGARRAGSKARNMSQAGKDILKRADVQSAVKERQLELAMGIDVTPEKVLREHARIGFSDIRNLFNPDGTLKALTELDDDTAGAVSSMKVLVTQGAVGNIHEVKMWAKSPALDALSKHLGLFEKRETRDQNETFDVTVTVRPKVD